MLFKIYKMTILVSILTMVNSFESASNASKATHEETIISLSNSNGYSKSVKKTDPEFQAWSDYQKSSGKLDSILTKCYECVSARNEEKKSSNYKNPAINSFYNPKYTDTDAGSLAWWLNGPMIKTGGQFVSSRDPSANTYNTPISNGYYGSSSRSYANKPMNSLSCIVGTLGIDAYAVSCEYGQNYCQTLIIHTLVPDQVLSYGYCVAVCGPATWSLPVDKGSGKAYTVCTMGTLSNKLSPICFIGDLSSSSSGVKPSVCGENFQCRIDSSYQADCVQSCINTRDSQTLNYTCSTADYPFQGIRGPMCYTGTFESGAALTACGNNQFCKTDRSIAGATVGSCVYGSCISSTTIACTTADFANKQGPLCYVGLFGNDASPMSCAKNQYCQRSTLITPFGSSISTGSCATTCVPSSSNFCCKTDFCNAYESTLNYGKCDDENYAPHH